MCFSLPFRIRMCSVKQLFVRNLPYRATDDDLSAVFSEHGTVKRAFVVSDPVTKESRGFGYVTFVSPDDAQKARSASIELFGRILHCKLADKHIKEPRKCNSIKTELKTELFSDEEERKIPLKASPPSVVEGSVNPTKSSDFKRCIAIRISAAKYYDALKLSVLSKLFSRNLVAVVEPPAKDIGENDKAFVMLECPTRAAAVDCYMQLKEFRENDSIKFTFSYLEKKQLTVKKEKLEEDEEEHEPGVGDNINDNSLISLREFKQFRLIVRNLPFSITQKALDAHFSTFGKLMEIVLPTKANGQVKGFAFVQFVDKSAAEKALAKVNLTKICGRTVAVDWAVPKSEYTNSSIVENSGNVGKTEETVKMEVDEMDEDVVVVDGNKKIEKVLPAPSHDIGEGRTVFIRGLSFSSDEVSLMEYFEQLFGSTLYAKICVDESGRSKGTGFVKFIKKSDADECIKQSTETPLTLDGRRLVVSTALDRKSAENVKSENAKANEGNDPRNLRLAPVGFFRQGTKPAEGVSAMDLQKRQALYSANCAKLRNPAMFVSETRLSVHNIPAAVDDKKLKEIFLKAVGDKSARVIECRVMRDLNRPNAAGVGKSRGFAFVAFKEHAHALAALEKLNNNADFFSDSKRLIIQFSVENRKALARKQRCLEKSKEHLRTDGKSSKKKQRSSRKLKNKKTAKPTKK